jgi:hypothetical protein
MSFEASREILPLNATKRLGPFGTIAKAWRERKGETAKKAENTRLFLRKSEKTPIECGFSTPCEEAGAPEEGP